MSRYKSILAAVVCLLLLTGCGRPQLPETIDKTTLAVDENGGVIVHLVESFDKDYYDLEELKTMVTEDAAVYNTDTATGESVPIKVLGVALMPGGKEVKVSYQYDSVDTYTLHTEGVLFFGTVADAVKAGYAVEDADFYNAKDGSDAEDDGLAAEMAEKHILITDQKAAIYPPYKVSHVSIGSVCMEDGGVDAARSTGEVYILMKK